MKRVTVYSIKEEVRTVEAGQAEFWEWCFDLLAWREPENNRDFVVRHDLPVYRIHDLGQDYYVAIAPDLLERLAPAASAT